MTHQAVCFHLFELQSLFWCGAVKLKRWHKRSCKDSCCTKNKRSYSVPLCPVEISFKIWYFFPTSHYCPFLFHSSVSILSVEWDIISTIFLLSASDKCVSVVNCIEWTTWVKWIRAWFSLWSCFFSLCLCFSSSTQPTLIFLFHFVFKHLTKIIGLIIISTWKPHHLCFSQWCL